MSRAGAGKLGDRARGGTPRPRPPRVRQDRPLVGRKALEARRRAAPGSSRGPASRRGPTRRPSGPSRRASSASSTSIATSSSAKSALPSAAPAIRDAAPGGSGARPSRFEISSRHSASLSGSRRIDVALGLPLLQLGRASSSSGRRDADEQDRGLRAKRRRRARSGRGRSARPSADRRARRRAACVRASASNSLPDRPEGFLAGPPSRAAEPERLGDALGDQLGLLVAGEPGGDRRRDTARRGRDPRRG